MKTSLLVLTLTTVVLGISTHSLAQAQVAAPSSEDFRVQLDRTHPEYSQTNAIGVIYRFKSEYEGTGFLVSSCAVLTNKHVINSQLSEVKKGDLVTFRVGSSRTESEPFSNFSKGQVVAMGSRHFGAYDWALIKLDQPLGNEVGYIEPLQLNADNQLGTVIMTAGFPFSKTRQGSVLNQIYSDLDCRLLKPGSQGEMKHTCQTTGGQSGSPLLTRSSDGRLYAIGIVQGTIGDGLGRGLKRGTYNSAVSFAHSKKGESQSIGDQIIQEIQKIRCN